MSKKPVKYYVKQGYQDMPIDFNIYELLSNVRVSMILDDKSASEGTILRRLRELREENELAYEVKNARSGEYRKV